MNLSEEIRGPLMQTKMTTQKELNLTCKNTVIK